ncbi:glycosyltransferase family 2 protein [Pedobacter sp.]|nr:glycosyltransferase family 2 protein [Candidatus Saccharibacteria bacterium]
MTDLEIPLGKRTKAYRFFEILPGALSYFVILLPVILSIINPLLAAIFVIVFIITYLVKAIAMAYRTIQGYDTLQQAQRVDWAHRLHDLEDPKKALVEYAHENTWRAEVHHARLEQQLITTNTKKPSDIYNAVVIATYNESRETLEPTIQAVLKSDYDAKHMILVIAYEQRGGAAIKQTVTDLIKEYGPRFGDALAVMHPADMPGEVVGKGGNITYAGYELKKHLEKKHIDFEDVIVTTLDADNRPHSTYFSYVTYEYLVHPEPRYVAFQPLALFLNNIWDVPAPMRVIATGNSFWNIINSLRPHMLRNFASHAQSMAALVDMNFWSTKTIVEDGHQFWRSYFRYDGHYDVVPIYVPIYQDAVLSDTYKKTLKAQFVQVRRWAYGASDIPYVATHVFRKDRTVPLMDGFFKFLRLLDSHVSWATVSIIVLLGAWAPLIINAESSRSIIAHELPTIVSNLQTIAMIGLFITVFLSFKLLPPRPERYKKRRNVWMLLQWVMMPITAIAYGSAAAFYSQTRLMFGRYLDKFDVTDKAVVKHDTTNDEA